MRRFLILIIAATLQLIPASPLAQAKPHKTAKKKAAAKKAAPSKVVHVNGYVEKDGTVVAPYDRTEPNGTQKDNWSATGNVNPETGKAGTKTPDK